MTATPSLGRRVVLVGTGVVVLVLVLVDTFLYVALRAGLHQSLQNLLTDRAAIARAYAEREPPDALAARLQELGLRAVVRTPDGTVRRAEPASPQLGGNLPLDTSDQTSISRVVPLPGGGAVQVFARTSGVSEALRRLLALEASGSAAAIVLAALLLRQATRVALRPVSEIAAAATRTAEGQRGERLRPDRPTTELGQMATSYDRMLETLEAAVEEARSAHAASALLAAIVNGSGDAIVSEDLDGTILTWNRGAERMYGYRAEEAIGRSSTLIVPVHRLAETKDLLQRVARGGQVSGHETERLTRGGTLVEVSVMVSPVQDAHRQVVGVSSIARDLTEQRWMAATLNETLEALQVALDEAKQSEQATRRFLADAAHQLRTPVTGIRACAETLLRGAALEDRDRLLATMVRETSRAGRLVTSLLQMARLDQGQPLTSSAVDVVALCRDEVDRVRLLAPDLDVELTVRGSPEGEWWTDGAALREIVTNLLDNARRHAATRIEVTVGGPSPDLIIRVADNGPGVAPGDQERVFERFVSLDGQGGSGLGLAIARSLARAMNGDLHYEAGFVLTVAAVTVPAAPPSTPPHAA